MFCINFRCHRGSPLATFLKSLLLERQGAKGDGMNYYFSK